jgi:hypothetical protein
VRERPGIPNRRYRTTVRLQLSKVWLRMSVMDAVSVRATAVYAIRRARNVMTQGHKEWVMTRVVVVSKTAYHQQVCRYRSKNLADGKLSANLQICNIADNVFGREIIASNSCVFCRTICYSSIMKSYSLSDISPSRTHNRRDRSPGCRLCYVTEQYVPRIGYLKESVRT